MNPAARCALVGGFLLFVGCGRPLTESEVALGQDIFGDSIAFEDVRIVKDFGLTPPPNRARVTVDLRRPAEDPCVRVPSPPRNAAPPGFAVGNVIFLSDGFYSVDSGFLWPEAVRLPHTLIFAHELVHVWQWQNRERTGYAPWRALAEGIGADAYFYRPDDGEQFLGFGYEQQASIVEDYLCYLILDPSDPEIDELRSLVAPIVDTDRLEKRVNAARR